MGADQVALSVREDAIVRLCCAFRHWRDKRADHLRMSAQRCQSKGRRNLVPTGEPDAVIDCDEVLIAVGQENAFPWIERDLGIEFDMWDVPKVDPVTFESTRKGVFFGGDAAFGPKNIIWAVEHGHQAAISIHKHCSGEALAERMPRGVNLQSRKVGMHEWSYKNDYDAAARRLMPHVSLKERFRRLDIEVERVIVLIVAVVIQPIVIRIVVGVVGVVDGAVIVVQGVDVDGVVVLIVAGFLVEAVIVGRRAAVVAGDLAAGVRLALRLGVGGHGREQSAQRDGG